MTMRGNKAAAVGAFVIVGVLLFGTGLFLIGDRRMIFEDHFEVYAEFSRISGLQNGATVRVAGMDAGEVETIHVPKGPASPFRVKLRIREDLHPLIRLDSVASIQSDGLVGNKFVQVETGSENVEMVPNRGTIHSREPFDLADMLQKMNDTIDNVNAMVSDVKGSIDKAFVSIDNVATDAQKLMDDVGKDVRVIMASGQKITRDLNVIVADVRGGRGTVGKLLTDDSLYQSATKIAAEAEKAMATVREASEQARGAIADFRGEGGPLKGVTGDLQQTLALAREAMADLSENTEALKRGFFFRGFFNQRGFFDLSDISVDEYRQGALETKDRRVLRIWVGTPVLFVRDANGEERLSDDGRLRLDSAITPLLKYPRTSPFVVEGYAGAAMAADRFLSSRRRAQLVRDYLVGKYGLDPNFVATMPMGAEAEGSPSGSHWDGVALAMFVAASAR
jgi:phospholipid/cholesterol/gamma-HCH transport system substrate-binding protein